MLGAADDIWLVDTAAGEIRLKTLERGLLELRGSTEKVLDAPSIVVDGPKMALVVELIMAIIDCDTELIAPEVLVAAALEADDCTMVCTATLPVDKVEMLIAAVELLAGGQ